MAKSYLPSFFSRDDDSFGRLVELTTAAMRRKARLALPRQ
jgi:hypothetical protein